MSLVKDPLSETMHGRGGFPVRTLIYVVFALLLIYMFYIYNNAQHSLKEAEMTGSRYKREAEERVNEIQDLVKAKDRYQEQCQNEKSELHNRIKSLNQQFLMVQGQNKETEADFIKLRQDMDTMRSEHSQADSAHAAEYEKLKQEKNSDIAKLKDEVADLTRQSQNSANIITTLREKLKETEAEYEAVKDRFQSMEDNLFRLQNAFKQLLDQNTQLQQKLQNSVTQQPHLDLKNPPLDLKNPPLDFKNPPQDLQNPPQDLQNPLRDLQNPLGDLQQQQHHDLQQHGGSTQHPLEPVADPRKLDHGQFGNLGAQENLGHDSFNKDIHDNFAMHQMQPPNNNNIESDDKKKADNDLHVRPEVNPNDEQRAQILEPILSQDKHQDGVISLNSQHEEEKRVKDDGAEGLLHKNPLALGQIEVPERLHNLDDPHGQGKNSDNQQAPPLFEENEHKDQEHGDEKNVRNAINPVDPDTL